MIQLSKLHENPNNARTISDEHFAALRRSVANRPWMFPLRPIVARRSDGVVLAGNMRLRALLANGVKEVPDDWIRWADLDERQCEEMCVVDNENYGDWIADDLLALYGRERLAEMDVDLDELLKNIKQPAEAVDLDDGESEPAAAPEKLVHCPKCGFAFAAPERIPNRKECHAKS
ncbi:MAG: ParB N-terminal domain-containing protein [Kiritimatiellae bacterium]|nr:ParB N-terminal domain-containing protein [Kiritimatiellia bacterium]